MLDRTLPRDTRRQQIIDEIDHLRRELAERRAFARPAGRSIVLAYHALLERQYARLDGLSSSESEQSINAP